MFLIKFQTVLIYAAYLLSILFFQHLPVAVSMPITERGKGVQLIKNYQKLLV
jgi:hypothetical protein